MTCEEVEYWLAGTYKDDLPAAVREDIRRHIEGCPACAAMEKEVGQLERLIAGTPEAYPGPGLEKRFREMVHTAEKEQKATRPVTRMLIWRNIAAAVILLAAGIRIGVYLSSSGKNPATLAKAPFVTRSGDSADSRLFTLLNSTSSSERIEAVNYTETLAAPNQKVIDALVNTLDHDKNANVRLACLYSLAKFADNPKVRDALVNSLPRQTEQIVQIVLINMLSEMKESRAIRPLQDIISNDKTPKEVKSIAEKGLRVM
jgi:HEAT repeats